MHSKHGQICLAWQSSDNSSSCSFSHFSSFQFCFQPLPHLNLQLQRNKKTNLNKKTNNFHILAFIFPFYAVLGRSVGKHNCSPSIVRYFYEFEKPSCILKQWFIWCKLILLLLLFSFRGWNCFFSVTIGKHNTTTINNHDTDSMKRYKISKRPCQPFFPL